MAAGHMASLPGRGFLWSPHTAGSYRRQFSQAPPSTLKPGGGAPLPGSSVSPPALCLPDPQGDSPGRPPITEAKKQGLARPATWGRSDILGLGRSAPTERLRRQAQRAPPGEERAGKMGEKEHLLQQDWERAVLMPPPKVFLARNKTKKVSTEIHKTDFQSIENEMHLRWRERGRDA